MSQHLFIAPTGVAPARWRDAFPNGVAWTAETVDLPGLPGGCVLWACAPGVDLPALVARLQGIRPDLPVVALDLQPTQPVAAAAFEAGARGYCHALATAPMLAQVAIVVSHGGLWVGPELMSRIVGATHHALPAAKGAHSALECLTARERAVAEEVARGGTNKEVARTLGITERTVKAHLSTAFAKLGVRDRLQLVLSLKTGNAAERVPA